MKAQESKSVEKNKKPKLQDEKKARETMRNKRLSFWASSPQISMVRAFARRGLSLQEIATKMGITKPMLIQWIKESPQIREALVKSGVAATFAAEDMLEKKVRDGEAWAVELYLKTFHSSTYDPDKWIGCEPPETFETGIVNEIQDILDGVYIDETIKGDD